MRREDLEKLLGGYAAGTLTGEERRALFEAALSDQALFDRLANEEPLRDALADAESRAQVLAALGDRPRSVPERFAGWLHRPQAWAAAATAAAVLVIGAVALRTGALHRAGPLKQEVAMVRTSTPAAAPQAAPAPAPDAVAPLAKARLAPKRRKQEQLRDMAAAANQIPASPPAPAAPPAPVLGAVSETIQVEAAPAESKAKDAGQPRLLLSAAAGPGPGAREIFYASGVPAVTGSARSDFAAVAQNATVRSEKRAGAADAPSPSRPADLGLRCSLMRRGVDGRYFEIPADTPLNVFEPARLRIESNGPGYLYVLADGAPIFTAPVAARQPALIDARPGMLSVILSRQPDPGPVDSLLERTKQQLAGARLRIDKPAQLRPRDEAVYIVNPTPTPDARILLEIQLTYK